MHGSGLILKVIPIVNSNKSNIFVNQLDEGIGSYEEKKMNSTKRISTIAGVLFIVELAVYTIGSTFTEGILNTPDYLARIFVNKGQITTGVLLEVITAACLLFIGVMMYPILKRYNRTVALGYFGIRIVETVFTAVFSIIHLSVFALSQEYAKAGYPDPSHFQTLGALLKRVLGFNYQIYFIFYSLGCLILFGSLFKAKFVPRFMSAFGLVTVALALIGIVSDMFGSGVGMEIYAMPLMLSQVFLGIWLIIKGFNPSTNVSVSIQANTANSSEQEQYS